MNLDEIKFLLKTWKIVYNQDKAVKVLKQRNINFEEVVEILRKWDILLIKPIEKQEYKNQYEAVFIYKWYPTVAIVKFNFEEKDIKLITCFPNRIYKFFLLS